MRTFTWKFATHLTICAIALCFAQNADAQWPCTTNYCNGWTMEVGAKAMDRPTGDFNIGSLITNSVTGQGLFNAQDALELGAGTGAEIKINHYRPERQYNLELRTVLGNWEESSTVLGPNLVSPLFPPGIDPNQFDYNYRSRFYSLEVNAKRSIMPGVTLLLGPRYVNFRENVAASTNVDVGFFNVTGTRETIARNSMLGIQTGVEFNIPVGQIASVQSGIKIGGYANPTEVEVITSDTFNGVTARDQSSKSTGTMIAEVHGRLFVQMIPNAVSGYAGYTATWIDGIALGPPQLLTFGGTGAVDTTNTPFWHSIDFGMILTY